MYRGASTETHGFVSWDPYAHTGPLHEFPDDDGAWGVAPDPRAWEAMPSLPPPEREIWPEPEGPDWLATFGLVAASAACSFVVGTTSAVVFFLLGVLVA